MYFCSNKRLPLRRTDRICLMAVFDQEIISDNHLMAVLGSLIAVIAY